MSLDLQQHLTTGLTDSERRVVIAALDAEHPDETPAGEGPTAFYDHLCTHPIDNRRGLVVPLLANIFALNRPDGPHRYADDTLRENAAHAIANPDGTPMERRWADLEANHLNQADIIFSRHGNEDYGVDYAFCHENPNGIVLAMLAHLGIRHVVHYSYPHIAARKTNYLGLDLATKSKWTAQALAEALDSFIDTWHQSRRKIPAEPLRHPVQDSTTGNLVLDLSDQIPTYSDGSHRVERYTNGTSITNAAAASAGLPGFLEPFVPLPPAAAALGCREGATTAGVNTSAPRFQKTGYYAEVLYPESPIVMVTRQPYDS